jgi:hypothetical protein
MTNLTKTKSPIMDVGAVCSCGHTKRVVNKQTNGYKYRVLICHKCKARRTKELTFKKILQCEAF